MTERDSQESKGDCLSPSMYRGSPDILGEDSRCDPILLGGFPVIARDSNLLHSITPL